MQQHARNPVDWYPWGEEAFKQAREADKPIFLSIGYSTCHWCHVMERESFSDPEVAALLNDIFIPIKVDREERPDIDNTYMSVCQMLTGKGGWPLTILMTPDKKPFFSGTYFPKENRFGQIGIRELITRIGHTWRTQRDQIRDSSEKINAALQQFTQHFQDSEPTQELFQVAYQQFENIFDEAYGGFGHAPKFPTPHNLMFLLRYWKRTGNEKALRMVEKTLISMRLGGIFDHVGFGFHRYSTDSQWLVPHFEKMIYDQALLVMAYAEAYQVTGRSEFAQTVDEVLTYCLRDMADPCGGFYGAEDADTEGEEGKFYTWTVSDIRKIFSEREADMVGEVFNIKTAGNFHVEGVGKSKGKNIIHMNKSLVGFASESGFSLETLKKRLEVARRNLFNERSKRPGPEKDRKVLTDWNGLMIAALAKSARVLDNGTYATAAKKAADFILEFMSDSDGNLYHRYMGGDRAIAGFLDDYAFFVWGLIELYQTDFQPRYLKAALRFTEKAIDQFWDSQNSGFYFTAHVASDLPVRQKEVYDGAIPSGNSVSMLNLLRLARITASSEFEERAFKMARRFSDRISKSPIGFTQWLCALDMALSPSCEVVIAGDSKSEKTIQMLKVLGKRFLPGVVVLLRPTEDEDPEIVEIAGFTKPLIGIKSKPTAYVCKGYKCNLPTTSPEKMLRLLEHDD